MSVIVNKLNDLLSVLNDGNKTEREKAAMIGFDIPQYRMFVGFVRQARSNARKLDKDASGPILNAEIKERSNDRNSNDSERVSQKS